MSKARELATFLNTTVFAQGEAEGLAPKASPVLSGDPKAPTPTAGDNDTSVATTAFVTAAVAAVNTSLLNSITTAVAAIKTIGQGQTYKTVSLATNTARRNTTGKPILVVIKLSTKEIGSTTKSYPTQTLSVSVDGSSWRDVATGPGVLLVLVAPLPSSPMAAITAGPMTSRASRASASSSFRNPAAAGNPST